MDILQKFKEIIKESQRPIVLEIGMCDGYHSNILLNLLSQNGRNFIYNGFEPVKLAKDAWKAMTFEEEKVNCSSLDVHLLKQNFSEEIIDFIWADIQGAEKDMIEGGIKTFKKVKYIYTEYNNSEMYEGCLTGLEQIRLLLPDFELIYDFGGDALFKNKKIQS